jgi:pimeloyl-ACP methyl ester carboxylesterase
MNRRPPSTKHAALAATAFAASSLLAGNPTPSEPARHVVLVPGIWDTAGTLRKMARALETAGLRATIVPLAPNNGRIRLDTLAMQVRDAVATHVPDHERFSIIGFSMGGLVARSYLRQFGAPARIATFVSISSPHRGTWLAWFSGAPGVRDMRPGSAFLEAIDADAARYHATRWITVRTPLDLMILPSESSSLPWARNDSVLVLMHPLMVLDGRVVRRIVSDLSPPPG